MYILLKTSRTICRRKQASFPLYINKGSRNMGGFKGLNWIIDLD